MGRSVEPSFLWIRPPTPTLTRSGTFSSLITRFVHELMDEVRSRDDLESLCYHLLLGTRETEKSRVRSFPQLVISLLLPLSGIMKSQLDIPVRIDSEGIVLPC